jgi:NADH:ubiquinone oxidoreductase subunit B-like Fe-S oxidoreductase
MNSKMSNTENGNVVTSASALISHVRHNSIEPLTFCTSRLYIRALLTYF